MDGLSKKTLDNENRLDPYWNNTLSILSEKVSKYTNFSVRLARESVFLSNIDIYIWSENKLWLTSILGRIQAPN